MKPMNHPIPLIVRTVALLGLVLPSNSMAASLAECVQTAIDNHPGLQGSVYRVQAARAAADEARSAYFPTVILSGGYQLTDNPSQAFMMALNQRGVDLSDPALDFNDPADTDNLRLSAGAQYRLYDGGQRRAGRQMAHLGVEAARHAADAFRNQLVYQVMDAYYRALQARAFVTVHEEALTSMKENLRVARERRDAGSALISDVLNLEVQVEQAREEAIRARHGLTLAVAALNTAIGSDLATADHLSAPDDPSGEAPPHDEERLVEHPEFLAARALLGVREQGVQQARRAYAPTLHAVGSTDWDSDPFSDFEQSYLVGVAAEWVGFDGHRRRSTLRAAQARRGEAEAAGQQVFNELRLGLKQAVTRVAEARERLTVTEAGQRSAHSAWQVTRELYEQGAATLSDLLTAESGLTAMRARHTAATYDLLSALANLERAQGRLKDAN